MMEIAVFLGLAALGMGVARWTEFPGIPFLLVGSLALNATGLISDLEFVEGILFLSVSVLLFVVGTDLSLERVGRFKRTALKIGLVQFACLATAGFGIAYWLEYSLTDGLYLGLALAASSTIVGVRLLQRRQQMFEPFGRTILGVLLLQDVLVVLLLPVLTQFPNGPQAMLQSMGGTFLLLAGAAIVMKGLVPFLLEREMDAETQLLVVLSILFGFLGAAYALNVSTFAAAFLAGVSLSEFPFSGIVNSEMQPLYDFFSAIFFASLGVAVGIPDTGELWHALPFAGAVLFLTPVIVVAVGEWTGLVARPALETGLLLSQTSELSLVVGLQALVVGQIGGGVFTVIVLTTVLTMIATPLITSETAVWEILRWHPSRHSGQLPEVPSDHVLIIGGGESGRPLIRLLRETEFQPIVIDEDPGVVHRLRNQGVTSIRGDGGDLPILLEAGAAQARIIVSTIQDPFATGPLLNYMSDKVPILVRVTEDHEADWVEERGGTSIRFSHAAADAFMDWFTEQLASSSHTEGDDS